MRRAYGFVFLMTLITIMVISLLVFASMGQVLMYFKAINQMEAQHHQFYHMEHTALALARRQLTAFEAGCVLSVDSINQVKQQLIHQEGCILLAGKVKYSYLVEDLGDFPCHTLERNNHQYSTHHRRVSLLRPHAKAPDSLLQIRMITAIPALPCVGKKRVVKEGVSSWRYFVAV